MAKKIMLSLVIILVPFILSTVMEYLYIIVRFLASETFRSYPSWIYKFVAYPAFGVVAVLIAYLCLHHRREKFVPISCFIMLAIVMIATLFTGMYLALAIIAIVTQVRTRKRLAMLEKESQ